MFKQEDLSSKPELFHVWKEALDISCIKNQIATDLAEVTEMGTLSTAERIHVKIMAYTVRSSSGKPRVLWVCLYSLEKGFEVLAGCLISFASYLT